MANTIDDGGGSGTGGGTGSSDDGVWLNDQALALVALLAVYLAWRN